MLYSSKGDIQIVGETSEILAELSVLIRQMRKVLTESFGREMADLMISNSGRMAYAENVENCEDVEGLR